MNYGFVMVIWIFITAENILKNITKDHYEGRYKHCYRCEKYGEFQILSAICQCYNDNYYIAIANELEFEGKKAHHMDRQEIMILLGRMIAYCEWEKAERKKC